MSNKSDPAIKFAAITPSDTVNLTVPCFGIYVGGAGNVSCINDAGTVVTFIGATAGSVLPVTTSRVNATLTTATSLVALAN
jgi:hypothetical protein